MSLSLAISLYIMGPTWDASMRAGGDIQFAQLLEKPSLKSVQALAPLLEPWREFMSRHAGERELLAVQSFAEHSQTQKPAERAKLDVGWRGIMLAFVLTELRQAFAMGFVLLLPFLVIDLIVANILVGLGMFMVTPAMISLPLKLMLFIAADGWILLSRGLIHSY